MVENYLKNKYGLGLIELMIAAVIMLFVLAGTMKVFTYQQSIISDENAKAKVRAKGRYAIKLIAREVRMAGFGLPPFRAITNSNPLPATVNTLSFRTNLQGAGTMVDSSSGPTDEGDTSISIVPGVAFSDGDRVVIYDPNDPEGDAFDLVTVEGNVSASATSMDFSPALTNEYPLLATAQAIPINKYNHYTIFQDGDQIKKNVDGVTVPIVNELELSSGGLIFDFNGATDTAEVDIIGITLNMLDPNNPDASIAFHTDVTLRNSRT